MSWNQNSSRHQVSAKTLIERLTVPFMIGLVVLLVLVLSYVFFFYKPQDKGIAEVLPDGRLPLPRFASLRSSEVNVRVGPGPQYPVVWTYKRQHLPLEITAEFDHWRKLRDFEGQEAWVNKGMLSSKRYVIVVSPTANLHSKPDRQSEVRAVLKKNVLGLLTEIKEPWCHIKLPGFKGWIMMHEVWGVTHIKGEQK